MDSRDSWARRPIADVLAELRRQGGGVVLMHDFDSYAGVPEAPSHFDLDHVPALTRSIIEMARAEGFHIIQMASLRPARR